MLHVLDPERLVEMFLLLACAAVPLGVFLAVV